jgi:methylase of polypeptide subunit release factors
MNALVQPLTRFYLKLRHQVLGRRQGRLVLEDVSGVPLIILPEVFNPVLFRTGAFLVQAVDQLTGPGRALDLGTGSGIGAIFAARRGYQVMGVDLNPEAVRCARLNVLLNRLEERVTIREGDLFAPVAGERFDLVLFNPPFYRGTPRHNFDQAWRATDVFERFATELPLALTPNGQALIVLSTDGAGDELLAALRANQFAIALVAQRDFGNEVLTVYDARQKDAGQTSRVS